MKKEEFLEKLAEIDIRRQIKMVAVFNADNIPTIGVSEIRRGRDWDETSAGYITDLNQFKEAFENLSTDELFVFGRTEECNHRIGFEEIKDCFKKDGYSAENAEYFYMRNCVTVSRLHCFVKKMDNGKFALFDCSTAGTCIVL